MPDSTISAPVAADPIDRLILGATDARGIAAAVAPVLPAGAMVSSLYQPGSMCMVED